MESTPEVVLEFGYTPNSPNYDPAVKCARKSKTYHQEGAKSQLRHFITLQEDEWQLWLQLLPLVQNWKSTRITHDESAPPVRIAVWILDCYLRRCQAEDKEAYCFQDNWIGCQKVSVGHSLMSDDKLGEFTSKEVFVLKKENIKQDMINDMERCKVCPAFDLERLNMRIDQFPSQIEIKENKYWEPIIESAPSTGVTRLVGIRWKSAQEEPEGPVMEEEELEALGGFSIRRLGMGVAQGYIPVWEHKILVFDHKTWMKYAHVGSIPELERFGVKGWQIVTITHENDEWYCILQRGK